VERLTDESLEKVDGVDRGDLKRSIGQISRLEELDRKARLHT
jgi:hypothetical protein